MIDGKPDIQTLNKPLPGDFCLLCGGKPDAIGIFIPKDAEKFGGIKGKTRLIRYCLCAKCQAKKDTPENVEKVITAELIGGCHAI